ncbi:MAG: tetratricopeptide repeat protein [Chloroflexota bacterium]|nr:tetratricopeptide repeat protein [Chloroflexota bacterium]
MAGDEALEALEAFDKAVARDPQSAYAWFARGVVLSGLKRYQEALESLDKVLAIDPQALAWSFRGLALVGLGRYQEAVESYEEALKHQPNFSDDWTAKNKALDRLQGWLDARRPPSLFVKLYELVAASEETLHLFIEQRLKQAFGESEGEWWAKGVPLPIRQKCAQRREEDPRRKPPFGYTDLIDLAGILDKNWRYFEGDYQRVKDKVKSKKEFLDNLARLNEIRRTVMHPVRDTPTDADHEFARWMLEVIRDFVGR